MNKMKLAIVGAMDSEITYLKEEMAKYGKVKEKTISGFVFYLGKLFNKDIVLVKSGVGRVMASVLFTILVENFKKIDKIINVGIAGGLGDLHIGDIIIGEKSVYGDVNLAVFDKYVYGQMSNCPPYFEADKDVVLKIKENKLDCLCGTICTNESFTTDYDAAKSLVDNHFSDLNVLAFDMESTAFAQCAYFFNKPFIAIRAISDVIGDSEQAKKYKDCFMEASIASNKFLLKLIEVL